MTISSLEPFAGKPTLLFAPPSGDESKYFTTVLSGDGQNEIREILTALGMIHKWREKVSVNKACMRIASLKQKDATQPPRGWEFKSLRRKYYAYTSTGKKNSKGEIEFYPGDWRVVWDQSKFPPQSIGLPRDFIFKLWHKLCENDTRTCAWAHSELKKIYETRFDSEGNYYPSIPGYDTWPDEDPFTGLPAGWTRSNLYRNKPSDYQLKAARVGVKAAADLRLSVIKTRVGLRVGEFIQFDDHEFNKKVNVPSQHQAMRPRSFVAADVFSACFFSFIFKPTLWDQVEEKKKALTQRDMIWFAINILMEFGYRADETGTKFVLEHGTAALPQWLIDRIFEVTGGKVTVQTSGRFNRKAHKGQWEVAAPKKGAGNFHFKALIECGFRIIDDALARLPGEVGKDRHHAPEQLYGSDAYNKMLLAKVSGMSVEDAAQFKFPYLLWHEFSDKAFLAFEEINNSHDHNLEGWEKLGFFQRVWRRCVGDPWKTPSALAEYSEEERRSIATALQRDSETLLRARKLSRREVFNAGKSELTKVGWHDLPRLLNYEKGFGKEITVTKGRFVFEDEEYGPGKFEYVAVTGDKNLSGTFLCFINPLNPSKLVACDENKKVVAICDLDVRPCYNDEKGIQKQLGQQNQWLANEHRPMEERHASDAAKLEHMKQHNAAIGKPPEIKSPIKTRGVRAEDFITFEGAKTTSRNEDPPASSAVDQLAALKSFK